MNLSLYTRQRIKRVIAISLFTSVGVTFFAFVENKSFEDFHLALLVGFLLGLPVGILEEFIIINRIFKPSLYLDIFLKAILYLLGIGVFFIVFVLLFVWFGDVPYERFEMFITHGEFFRAILYTFFVFDMVIVFNQYEKLLGTDVMLLYAYGKYQQPEHEKRIFMFLDISSSTVLAESMQPDLYFGFINDFFHDISEPVLQTSAQIYQYVGDEVVFTWKVEDGIKNNNCANLFYLIDDQIEKKKKNYLKKYNCIPEYKAGMHCGEVIAAVVGDIKKELIYNGDVINTASRIRSYCKEANKRFLVSADLISKFENIDDFYHIESLGISQLKGKNNIIGLFSIEKRN
jgi:adenylate cyclase